MALHLNCGRGAALELLHQTSDADVAFARAEGLIAALPLAKQAPLLLPLGFAVSKRLPDMAESIFTKVLSQQAHQPQALYGRAMLLVQSERESEAVACFDKALASHPNYVDARRFRAFLLSRVGKLAEAQDDINCCIQQEPHSGITLYAAACVLARAAAKNLDQQTRTKLENQAIDFLKSAFAQGYGRATAAADRDLSALQHRSEFKSLIHSKKTN